MRRNVTRILGVDRRTSFAHTLTHWYVLDDWSNLMSRRLFSSFDIDSHYLGQELVECCSQESGREILTLTLTSPSPSICNRSTR